MLVDAIESFALICNSRAWIIKVDSNAVAHLSAHRRHASQVVYAIAIAPRRATSSTKVESHIFLLRIADMHSKLCMFLLAS